MKLILCVDDKGGLAFNHRRQSRDRVLNERILMHCGMHRLWISPYTAKLFGADTAVRLCIAEDCLERAEEDDYCFAEVHNPAPYLNRVQQVILYHWNRVYPADPVFHPAGNRMDKAERDRICRFLSWKKYRGSIC